MSSVTHPTHYNSGKIEVIEIIEDQNLGFHLGNAVKYILRAGKKDVLKVVEDLEKAIWYLRRQIELVESEVTGRDPVRPNDMNPREGEKPVSGFSIRWLAVWTAADVKLDPKERKQIEDLVSYNMIEWSAAREPT